MDVSSRSGPVQGSSDAQYKLGMLNEQGKGTQRDIASAKRWYTLVSQYAK